MSAEGVEVLLLGPLEARVGGVAVPLPGRRVRTLLAVLALSAGRPVATDVLADRIWGEDLPANVRGSLQTAVMRLRRELGAETVERSPGGYLLRVDRSAVDALRFEQLAGDSCGDSSGDSRQDRLGAALALWRGDPFEESLSDWLSDHERPRLVELYLSTLERLADLDRTGAWMVELSDAVARHPLRESLWVRLMRSLHGAGRSAEALEQYSQARASIAAELGVEPGPELRLAYTEMLAADAEQVEAPSARAGEPAFEPPRQLPADISHFTGRQAELAELDAVAARTDAVAIAAITGPGGAGKTSLAVHWAHRARDRFPDGQVYLNLRGFSAGRPVAAVDALGMLLRAVGVPDRDVPDGLEPRSALLRTRLAGKRMLVLLDNARAVDQVRPLLPGTAGCVVLVTSRNQLRGLGSRNGARRLPLTALDPAAGAELIAASIGADRAAAEPNAVSRLVRYAGGLPLALTIAGERALRYGEQSLAAVAGELADEHRRLDSLGDPDDPENDLRAVFSWSYAALDEETAAYFRLLGTMPSGDFGADAAACLADLCGLDGATAAARTLDRLVAANLLEQPCPGRYQYHDLIRVYAAELGRRATAPDELDRAIDRVLDYYLDGVFRAAAIVAPHRLAGESAPPSPVQAARLDDHAEALAWWEIERRAVAGAVELATAHGRDSYAWQLAWHTGPLLARSRVSDDVLLVAELGLAAADRLGDHRARYLAAGTLGLVYHRLRRHEDAVTTFESAMRSCRRRGHPAAEALILTRLGSSCHDAGRMRAALAYHEQALAALDRAEAAPVAGDVLTPSRAGILLNLGGSHTRSGDPAAGIKYTLEAVAAARRSGHHQVEAQAQGNLAEAYLAQGDYAEAAAAAEEALHWMRRYLRVGEPIAETLHTLGLALVALGRTDESRQAWHEALFSLADADHPLAVRLHGLLADHASARNRRWLA